MSVVMATPTGLFNLAIALAPSTEPEAPEPVTVVTTLVVMTIFRKALLLRSTMSIKVPLDDMAPRNGDLKLANDPVPSVSVCTAGFPASVVTAAVEMTNLRIVCAALSMTMAKVSSLDITDIQLNKRH